MVNDSLFVGTADATALSIAPMPWDRIRRDHPSIHREASIQPPPGHPRIKIRTLMGGFEPMGIPKSFVRNAEIYGEGEPTEHLYRVVNGTVRTCKLLSDGRRQVASFHLPGEIFGVELRDERSFSAEAISDAVVLVFKRSAMIELAQRDGDAARDLWILTAHQLQQAQDHLLLLAKSAQERVAAFLLEMAMRMPDGNAIDLPMSRRDVADYLGLTIETVSRTLTQLENDAAIELPTSRRVVLRNRASLGCLSA